MASVVGHGLLVIDAEISSSSFDGVTKAAEKAGSEGGKKASGFFGNVLKSSIGKISIGTAIGSVLSKGISKAGSVISSSLDAAISRVDTLNQFPKVMQNLGFSAEQASFSVNTMAERLKGLPTSLDSLTATTQQFAQSPLISSLEEATDLSLAFNNALLAGGAASSAQESALYAYTKALSSGNISGQEWIQISQAIPGQLSQIAETMLGAGASADDLRVALSNGEVSLEDFNKAILDLDKNGGAGFVSFADQAKSATGGIRTSLDLIQTAIARGLGNILEPFAPLISQAAQLVSKLIDTMSEGIVGGIESLNIVGIIESGIENGKSPLEIGIRIATALLEGLAQSAPNIVDGLLSIIESLANTIIESVPVILESAITLIGAIVDAIPQVIPKLIDGAINLVESLLNTLVNSSEKLLSTGIELILQLVISILQATPKIITALIALIPKLVTALLSMIPKLIKAGIDLFLGLVKALPIILPQLIRALIDLGPQIVGAIISLIPELINAGVQLVGGLVTGLWQAAGAVGAALLQIGKNALNSFLSFLGIGGASSAPTAPMSAPNYSSPSLSGPAYPRASWRYGNPMGSRIDTMFSDGAIVVNSRGGDERRIAVEVVDRIAAMATRQMGYGF